MNKEDIQFSLHEFTGKISPILNLTLTSLTAYIMGKVYYICKELTSFAWFKVRLSSMTSLFCRYLANTWSSVELELQMQNSMREHNLKLEETRCVMIEPTTTYLSCTGLLSLDLWVLDFELNLNFSCRNYYFSCM